MNREEALKMSKFILSSYIEFRMPDEDAVKQVKSVIKYLEENLK